MSDGMPADPISDLRAGAAQLHELFMSFVESGFSEGQALYLVGVLIAAMRKPDMPE